jgi:hypothetical protein
MDFRRWTGTRFVSRAPTRSGEYAALRVAEMDSAHVLWWHAHVQPLIDRDPQRVDQGWNWLLYAPFSYVAGNVMGRSPVGYTVGLVVEESGQFVPCALALLLGEYHALTNHRQLSTFTWYLTTAPVEAMVSIAEFDLTEDQVPKRLGSIALDVSVTHSLNHKGRGRVALYADQTGGAQLLRWYEQQGMQILPRQARIPPGPRRFFKPSDGRYCYFTSKTGLAFSRSLDSLR